MVCNHDFDKTHVQLYVQYYPDGWIILAEEVKWEVFTDMD